MKYKKLVKLSALPLVFATAQASAATISYYLDQSNDLPDGINYAQVTISDGIGGDIDFSVDVIESAFSISPGANFGMQTFSFNYDTALTISDSNIQDIDPSSWTISQDASAGGDFGKFEFQLSGTGSSRTSLLSFSITGVSSDTVYDYAIGSTLNPSSGQFFAAHIAGFDETYGVTSAQFAGSTSVPVPAAIWLFGSGLMGLIAVGRKKV
jgi:hypothetical protein